MANHHKNNLRLMTNGVIAPRVGDNIHYVCLACRKRFLAKKRLFPISVCCPSCGGIAIEDHCVMY